MDAHGPRHSELGSEVGVIEDDVGRLPAEFEEEALERRRSLLHDAPADGGRASEGDEVHPWIGHQVLGYLVVRRRHHLEDAGREVGPLGDQPADTGGVPRCVRRGLEDHGVAGGQRRAELVERHLEGVVPRDDGGDDAGRLLDHRPPGPPPERRSDGEVALPLELVDVGRRPFEGLAQRGVELRTVGHEDGCPDLGHQLRPQELLLLLESGLQLGEALLAELLVRRPIGLVEGLPGGGDGLVHVVVAGVGHQSEELLGGRIDVLEGLARPGLDQLAPDEHAGLTRHGGGLLAGGGHGRAPLTASQPHSPHRPGHGARHRLTAPT